MREPNFFPGDAAAFAAAIVAIFAARNNALLFVLGAIVGGAGWVLGGRGGGDGAVRGCSTVRELNELGGAAPDMDLRGAAGWCVE